MNNTTKVGSSNNNHSLINYKSLAKKLGFKENQEVINNETTKHVNTKMQANMYLKCPLCV